MEVRLCTDEIKWENFNSENSDIFLQSFDWGNFQEKNGKKTFRLQAVENSSIFAQALVIKERFSLYNYLYIPYGPIFKKDLKSEKKNIIVDCLFQGIKKIADLQKSLFLRIEPNCELEVNKKKWTIVSSPTRLQPQKTLTINLAENENQILSNFKPKTRQNINFAKKNNIQVKQNSANFDKFWSLMKKTKDRQEIRLHDKNYYKKFLSFRGKWLKFELFSAELKSEIINAVIVAFYGKTAFSLHGGSDYRYRHFKSSNLLYWEIMKSAKEDGFKTFDFWGIDERKWPGVTTFKKGFGGIEIKYPLGFDVVYRKNWYRFYKIIKKFR